MANDDYNATHYGNRTQAAEETKAWPSPDWSRSQGSNYCSRSAGNPNRVGEHGGIDATPAVH